MKYGFVLHNYSANIGDDIQTYAAKRFLPHIDYRILREKIDGFESKADEPVAAIVNGWFMFKKWSWPPAPQILPLFIGFHYSTHPRTQMGYDYLASGAGQEYMKIHGPIGCRDLYTQNELEKLGIPAYFSGCVTLTLPNMPKTQQDREYICLVDTAEDVADFVRQQVAGHDIDVKAVTHKKPRDTTERWGVREKRVKELLTLYQNAKCVFSSRIHCTLPCLALGTPVLHIGDTIDEQRFIPYVNMVHYSTRGDLISGKTAFSALAPPENPDAYKPYRDDIIRRIVDFIDQMEALQPLAAKARTEQVSRQEILQWQNTLMEDTLSKFQKKLNTRL